MPTEYESIQSLMCRCGHPVSEHHVSWFPGGGVLVEECEADGVAWDHCHHFREQEGGNR